MARTKGALGKNTLAKMGQSIVKPVTKKENTGKRGRPKKDKTFDTVILPVIEHKIKPVKIEEVYTTELIKVDKINQLSGKYCHMQSGDNYQDAVNQTQKIMQEQGYTIVNYYEQKTFGRSIIVSYNKTKPEEKVNNILESVLELADTIINDMGQKLPAFYKFEDAQEFINMITESIHGVLQIKNSDNLFVVCA